MHNIPRVNGLNDRISFIKTIARENFVNIANLILYIIIVLFFYSDYIIAVIFVLLGVASSTTLSGSGCMSMSMGTIANGTNSLLTGT